MGSTESASTQTGAALESLDIHSDDAYGVGLGALIHGKSISFSDMNGGSWFQNQCYASQEASYHVTYLYGDEKYSAGIT